MCHGLLAQCRQVAGVHRFRFKNTLLSLDATVIDLCAEVSPWATFRRTKGAVKLHFTLDHDGCLPTWILITEGARHEITVARQQAFAPGTILVFDRGYADFGRFAPLDTAGVFFVTRLKDTVADEVVKRHPVPDRGHVRAHAWIALTGQQASHKYREGLRRVEVWVPEEARTLVFLANHLAFGPTTIARTYTTAGRSNYCSQP